MGLKHALLLRIFTDAHCKTVDTLHCHHWTHEDVDVVHAAEREKGQLDDTSQLQTHYFGRKNREKHDPV